MTALDNRTPWAVAVLGVAGARGEPALCVAIEATCSIADGRPLEAQPAIELDGTWHGDPAASSPIDAPCAPLPKAGIDCLLRGHGHARRVSFRCGPVRQEADLHGARIWTRGWLGTAPGAEAPFTPVPLRWEEACGPQPSNPVGTGLSGSGEVFHDGIALPRITAAGQGRLRWGRAVPAPGFGPTAPAWLHRRDLAACSPQAQNIAPPGLVAATLHRDDDIAVAGCAAPISCRLPPLAPPRVVLARRRGDLRPEAVLDTVVVDADTMSIRLTWRAWCLVGGHELVDAVEVA